MAKRWKCLEKAKNFAALPLFYLFECAFFFIYYDSLAIVTVEQLLFHAGDGRHQRHLYTSATYTGSDTWLEKFSVTFA